MEDPKSTGPSERVIAIDGPSGSGKSLVARKVASEFGFHYIDTGAMFRALAIVTASLDFDPKANSLTEAQAKRIRCCLDDANLQYAPNEDSLICNGQHDLTIELRKNHVSLLASQISKFPVFREFAKKWQHQLAVKHWVVMEGRDIGTVIFPHAELKIFLIADPEIRAKRRFLELQKRKDFDGSFESVLEEIKLRDEQDCNRKIAPLKKAADAIEIDCSNMAPQEVSKKIARIFKERKGSSWPSNG